MEKEEIVIGEPVNIDEHTIVPIIRISLHYNKNKEGDIIIATKNPLAVLATVGSKIMLYIIENDISMEQLIEELPDLKTFFVK